LLQNIYPLHYYFFEADKLKKNIRKWIANLDLGKLLPEYFLLTMGSVILAVNFDLFLAPFNIAPGGVSGSAIIIHEFTGWPKGLTMLILTLPMLIVGFFYLGRFRFLVRASYVTLVYSMGIDALVIYLPTGVTKDLLLNALYGGILGGIGIGLIYRGGTSPAGTSVISRVIQMKTGIPNSQLYMLIDGGVILIAGLVFGWEMALYAFITLFTWGFVADYILEGPSVVRTVFIVTDLPEAVSRVLMDRLGVGVTGWEVKGMFSQTEHTTLFCTVNRSDANVLKSIINDADPKAFVVIAQGHQAKGGRLRKMTKMANTV
jgi:uncharacterized membrane-anchored protein YitT (DUF2179 family)